MASVDPVATPISLPWSSGAATGGGGLTGAIRSSIGARVRDAHATSMRQSTATTPRRVIGSRSKGRFGNGRIGGIIFAARVNGVNLASGGGDTLLNAIAAAVIGGTSLFGGRGVVRSALLGGLIISMISNGIDLVGYSPATKLITTGVILLLAVTLDTLSRRRLEATGR